VNNLDPDTDRQPLGPAERAAQDWLERQATHPSPAFRERGRAVVRRAAIDRGLRRHAIVLLASGWLALVLAGLVVLFAGGA
jgi:hypothetical protein